MPNIRGLYDDKNDDEKDDKKDTNNRFVGGIGAQGGGRYVTSCLSFGCAIWPSLVAFLCLQASLRRANRYRYDHGGQGKNSTTVTVQAWF